MEILDKHFGQVCELDIMNELEVVSGDGDVHRSDVGVGATWGLRDVRWEYWMVGVVGTCRRFCGMGKSVYSGGPT